MSAHNAKVVAYSAHPEDTRLTLKIECGDHEWGWTRDAPGAFDKLAELAARHNDGTTETSEP